MFATSGRDVIQVSGSGLDPGSSVRLNSDMFGPDDYVVGQDGTFGKGRSLGYMAPRNSSVSFSVWASDATGALLEGTVTATT